MKSVYEILIAKSNGKCHLRDPETDGSTIVMNTVWNG
jgi:hypothetical protein